MKKLLMTTVLMTTSLLALATNARDTRLLVVYYTYSGVTEIVATQAAEECNGEVLKVVDHGNYPYPESGTTYTYANNERSRIDAGEWPEIKTQVESFDQWDAVIICTPLWNGKMANPMLTFLHNHADKLAGKQVALAVTSYSSGVSGVVSDLRAVLPGSTLVGGTLHIAYSDRGNIPVAVMDWLDTIDFETASQTSQVRVTAGGHTFTASLADNDAAQAFQALLPLTLDMTELNGNEKYHYLDTNLPSNPSCPGTIHAGDLMLYGRSCVVLFYETFETGYSYTRIGAIDDPTGLAQALGAGAVTVTFESMAAGLGGDVDGDGELSIGDVTALIDLLLAAGGNNLAAADVDGDGEVGIGDVTALIDILLSRG